MADLPGDVLHKISSYLLVKDRNSFRSVCTSWRSALPLLPEAQLLTKSLKEVESVTGFPFLMYSGLESSVRNFYHPTHNTTYVMDFPEISDCITLYSKHGWLIMARGRSKIFFFNPTIGKIIDLPDTDEPISRNANVSFSSVPTSSDCIVFCLICTGIAQTIKKIRRGETEWTNYWYCDKTIDFQGSCSHPVFHNGFFYCLDIKGLLATFDPAEEDDEANWTILKKPERPCTSLSTNHLLECDGNLISVFVGRFGKWIKIFKLDSETMMWKKVENLGDKTLFLSQGTSLSVSSSDVKITGLGNKIFFPRFWGEHGCSSKNSTIFYSLDTCKFHSLGTGIISDDFYGTTLKLFCTWFSPVNSDEFPDDGEFSW